MSTIYHPKLHRTTSQFTRELPLLIMVLSVIVSMTVNWAIMYVMDSKEEILGSKNENPNGTSPRNSAATTITDELRLRNDFKSKVISVSNMDRAAILPEVKSANAAYKNNWDSIWF